MKIYLHTLCTHKVKIFVCYVKTELLLHLYTSTWINVVYSFLFFYFGQRFFDRTNKE